MIVSEEREPFGWSGSVAQFLNSPQGEVISALEVHLKALLGMPAAGSQRTAWTDEIDVLRAALRDAAIAKPDLVRWGMVFEYELHLEGGRRPDVVLHTGLEVVVLEFKNQVKVNLADVDQAAAYARDLQEYHSESHLMAVQGVLVPTKSLNVGWVVDGVRICPPRELAGYLVSQAGTGINDFPTWLGAEYAPLPGLIEAARMIFRKERLPSIRRCLSSGVPEAVELLGQIAEESAKSSSRSLSFLAGVPGAGKTLAGLQLVYERSESLGNAVFLSGNVPLVEVLRGALDSKVFVKDLHAFIKTYSDTTRAPIEHVVVFDEAQRAWDKGYMEFKKGVSRSEPQILIEIGERIPEWISLVGLVGDGQEIHSGEESGMGQWAEALRCGDESLWSVYCPSRLAPDFVGLDVKVDERLDLTVSLRSRVAEHLHEWVQAVLDGRFSQAARLAQQIRASAFTMYLTRDLESAKQYARDRYDGDTDARYGMLASSRTQSFLPKFNVDTSWPATKRVKFSKWYNASAGEAGSCCELSDVVTEFGCQGLELDMPIVAWGNDLFWSGESWTVKSYGSRYELRDPEQLRKNAYRVLLTRGRDGLVIYIPDTPVLDATELALLSAGVQLIPTEMSLAV